MYTVFGPNFWEGRPQLFMAICRIYGGWVKLWSNCKPFVDQSACHFKETPRSCQRTCPIMYNVCHISFRRYRPLHLPLSCEVVQNRCFWASDFRTHLRACGQFWLSSVQRAWRVADERKKTRKKKKNRGKSKT